MNGTAHIQDESFFNVGSRCIIRAYDSNSSTGLWTGSIFSIEHRETELALTVFPYMEMILNLLKEELRSQRRRDEAFATHLKSLSALSSAFADIK